jgi:cytochrome c oxidase accessory protein FixG
MTAPTEEKKDQAPKPEGNVNRVDWRDYRDHLATADKEGHRQWVYPRKPAGRWHRRRVWFSILLLAILFAGPFIRINGNPYFMFNIVERRFSILGQIFWPQDNIIFAVAMLLFVTSIIVFTTAFGRLWCGWTCPQTLLMEMVFRKIEYAIEGDAFEQRALHAAPWTPGKTLRKLLKHGIFFALSFIIGNTLLSYIIGSDELIRIITDDPRNHTVGLTFMVLFTLLFYAIFARFREQACTFICPYGRLQSTVIDENTLVVAYDHKRGENRAPWKRSQPLELRRADGAGDCVNCRACVAVCPTGIDIRNGTQMECVNCTACIDACDNVMDKIARPRGLIRYASLNSIERGETIKFTARMKMYLVALAALAGVLGILLFTRSDVETMLLRAPGALFQQLSDGRIENLYTIKIVNKTTRDIGLHLKLEDMEGQVSIMGTGELNVPKAALAQTSVLIAVDPRSLKGSATKVRLGVYDSAGRKLQTINTVLVGPRTAAP